MTWIQIGKCFASNEQSRKIECKLCGEYILKGEMCLNYFHRHGVFRIHIKHLSEEMLNEIKIQAL